MAQENYKQVRKLVLIKPDFSGKKQKKSDPQYKIQQFFKAADRSELSIVRECLENGMNINTFDNTGRTLSHVAAENGNTALAEIILKWPGNNLDLQTFDFLYTPLHEAVMLERIEIIKMYLAAGAKINKRNCHGETVVHIAVKLHSVDILKLLFPYKANLNVCDVFSNTPLSLAVVDKKSFYLTGLLLGRGAKVNKYRKNCMYVFHEAVFHCLCKAEVCFVQLLVKYGAVINYIDPLGKNALHYAAIAGIPELVQYLIHIGVNLYIKDKTHRTPYDIAKEHGHYFACKLMRQQMKNEDIFRITGIHVL